MDAPAGEPLLDRARVGIDLEHGQRQAAGAAAGRLLRPQAVANVCSHLGGPLERCGDRLVCAWHNAEFDAGTGERLSGPARPETRLMILPTRIINGVLTYVWGQD